MHMRGKGGAECSADSQKAVRTTFSGSWTLARRLFWLMDKINVPAEKALVHDPENVPALAPSAGTFCP